MRTLTGHAPYSKAYAGIQVKTQKNRYGAEQKPADSLFSQQDHSRNTANKQNAALCPSHSRIFDDTNKDIKFLCGRIEETSAMSDHKIKDQPDTISSMTPEELRRPLLAAMLPHVAFDGWTQTALELAADDLGISHEMAELAYPRGAIEVLDEHLKQENKALVEALTKKDLPSMKIRDRITTAIRTRLELGIETREVARRSMAVMALPQNLAMGPKALWQIADTMWRAAGDTSTDHNWYTKRMTLSAVYSSVLLYWLADESEDFQDTWAFLDRRIEDVMQIEKTKWQIRKATENLPSLSRFLGHLRRPSV